jgi:hypothetical protein
MLKKISKVYEVIHVLGINYISVDVFSIFVYDKTLCSTILDTN